MKNKALSLMLKTTFRRLPVGNQNDFSEHLKRGGCKILDSFCQQLGHSLTLNTQFDVANLFCVLWPSVCILMGIPGTTNQRLN